MGTCCDPEEKPKRADPQLKKGVEPLRLEFDDNHLLMSSYKRQDRVFQKLNYDWFSIPIISVIHTNNTKYFQVINRGINNDNFLAGVITKKCIQSKTRTPWKTPFVICFESYGGEGQSGIVSSENLQKCGKGIKSGEVLTVLVNSEFIEFKQGELSLGKKMLTKQLKNTELLPYVSLFAEGDKIEFVDPSSSSATISTH